MLFSPSFLPYNVHILKHQCLYFIQNHPLFFTLKDDLDLKVIVKLNHCFFPQCCVHLILATDFLGYDPRRRHMVSLRFLLFLFEQHSYRCVFYLFFLPQFVTSKDEIADKNGRPERRRSVIQSLHRVQKQKRQVFGTRLSASSISYSGSSTFHRPYR